MNDRLARWTGESGATAHHLLVGEEERAHQRISLKFLWTLLVLTVGCGFTSAYVYRRWGPRFLNQHTGPEELQLKNTDAWLERDDWIRGTAERAPTLPDIIYEHPELCSSLHAESSVIAISTRAASEDVRTFARKVLRPYIMSDLNIIFVLGSSDHETNERVADEAKAYRDMVIGGYVDSDANLENGGHPVGLRFSANCAAVPLKDQAHVGVTERTLLNYRELSTLLNSLTGAPWDELLGAPETKHLSQFDTGAAEFVDRGGVISRWVKDGEEIRAASSSFIAPVTATRRLLPAMTKVHEACWGRAADPAQATLLSVDLPLPVLRQVGLDLVPSTPAPTDCSKSSQSFRQLLAETTIDSKLMLITTDRFFADSADVCGGDKCQCKDWVTALMPTDAKSPIPHYALLYEDCKDLFRAQTVGSNTSESGLAGTPWRGPSMPNYVYDIDYCKELDGAAAVMLTRSDDFELRKQLREWHKKVKTKIKLVFPIGKRNGKRGAMVNEKVRKEEEKYADLIIGDYHDYYSTLSSTTAMFMSWTAECSKVNDKLRWIVKCDADMTPNLPLLERLFDELWDQGIPASKVWPANTALKDEVFRPQKYPFWMGMVWEEGTMGVITNAGHKNYEDLNLSAMPRYLSGPLYTMSALTARRLAAQRLMPHLVDVYIRNEDAMVGMLVADINAARDVQFHPSPGETKLGREMMPNEPDIPLYPFNMPTLYTNSSKQSPLAGCKGSGRLNHPADCDCHKVFGYPTLDARRTVENCDWSQFDAKQLPPLTLSTKPHSTFVWPSHLYNVKGRGVEPLPSSWIDQFTDADALLKQRRKHEDQQPSSTKAELAK